MKIGLAYKGTVAELAKLGYDASHLEDRWPYNCEKIGDIVYQRRDDLEGDKCPLQQYECLVGTLEEIQEHVCEKYDSVSSYTLEEQFEHYRNKNLDSFFGIIF